MAGVIVGTFGGIAVGLVPALFVVVRYCRTASMSGHLLAWRRAIYEKCG